MEIEEFVKRRTLAELDEALEDAKDAGVTREEALKEVEETYTEE